MPIDGDRAQQVLAAAEAEARKSNFSVSLAVVDPNGNLVVFKRMPPHPGPTTGPIAIRLAQTAAHTRMPSKMLGAMMSATGIPVVQLIPDMVALDGGYPIVVDGKLVGAIGAFGATVDQNARAAAAGAASVR